MAYFAQKLTRIVKKRMGEKHFPSPGTLREFERCKPGSKKNVVIKGFMVS